MKRDNRYLKVREGRYVYRRRVPLKVSHLDSRGMIEEAIGTDSLEAARRVRDAMAEADEAYWRSLLEARGSDRLQLRYDAARSRAKALGFSWRSLEDLTDNAPTGAILERLEALEGKGGAELRRTADAALGGAPAPAMKVSRALEIYLDKIAPDELDGKSPKQIADFKKVKRRAINNFIALCTDKSIWDIDRADALVFRDWWQARIAAGRSGNSANRDLGNMRKLWREIAQREGKADLENPFDGLTFADPKRKRKQVRPFSQAWIRDRLLRADAYAATREHPRAIRRDAAAIFLIVLETGCRPSEICNILPARIRLDAEIPHIAVDFDEARQIKTESSVRVIPLVGIALEAMKRFPQGFEHYRDKETAFSNMMMKHLRRRALLPSEDHRVYSARHAFEDRLKEAGVGDEMRRLLMGHTINRPEYGSGGTLDYRLKLLKRIELPYDPALLDFLEG